MFDIGPRNFSSLIFFLLDHAISSVASALLDGHDMTKLSEMRRKKHTTERERQALKVINRSYFQSGERESSTSSHSRCNIFNSHSREFSSCVDFEEKITKFTFCSFTYRLYHFKVYRFIVGFVFALKWQVFVEHDGGGEEGGFVHCQKLQQQHRQQACLMRMKIRSLSLILLQTEWEKT